jgi:hypothetical protein
MCDDKNVIYLEWSLCLMKLPNVKKNVTFFSLLLNPEIIKWKKKFFVEFLMLAQGFCPLLFFMYLCIKKSVHCLLWD